MELEIILRFDQALMQHPELPLYMHCASARICPMAFLPGPKAFLEIIDTEDFLSAYVRKYLFTPLFFQA